MTLLRLRALAFAALLVLLVLVFLRDSLPSKVSAGPLISPSVEVRFSRPAAAGPQTLGGGPLEELIHALDAATTSVDMAIYDLDLDGVSDALVRAEARGVAVRLVVESDNLESPEMLDLVAAGIPLVGDGRPPLMHDKFTVIDGGEVWTGSMNYTVSDATFNDNNLVRLRDATAADAFREEFDEMFLESRFGALSAPSAGSALAAGPLEVYFAPDDHVAGRVIELIESAQDRIVFLAFALTSSDIARALEAQAAAGIDVRGVMDAGQAANLGSRYLELRDSSVDVRLDGNPDRMHHKVIVIDDRAVITGSYNFSTSAETENDENLIVLHDPAVAAVFLEEFERVFGLASP